MPAEVSGKTTYSSGKTFFKQKEAKLAKPEGWSQERGCSDRPGHQGALAGRPSDMNANPKQLAIKTSWTAGATKKYFQAKIANPT